MIIDAIKRSGLYNAAKEIRCGVLHESGNHCDIDKSRILEDPKFRVVYIGKPEEYERPTLLHMRGAAAEEKDPLDTKYFYLHTKGIQWFGTPFEECVVDWIKLMLYWNVEKWINAEDTLNKYDTYGCNYYSGEKYPLHYSGNFFWTTSHHLKTLPSTIGPNYNDTEFWLCSDGAFNGKPNAYNVFSSCFDDGFGHYNHIYPESRYRDDI
jgi:hypothetical protein